MFRIDFFPRDISIIDTISLSTVLFIFPDVSV